MQINVHSNNKLTLQKNIRASFYKKNIKRSLDFILALLSIVLFSPLLLIIALIVKIKLGSPIIFKHKRPGLNEKIFTVYKFRTMTSEKDETGALLPDNIRLTKFGKILRTSSLDELPELINIIKGDMSIVGPRPLEVYFLPYYSEKEKLRHSVRPGLTGLAQVKGRNNLSWEQRFEYDLQYINNITFSNDVLIFFKTIIKVFKREGTSIPDEDFNIFREKQKKIEANHG